MVLLADRAAQVLGLEQREAGELLGDRHALLLEDRDADRPAEDRLQARIEIGDRFEAVLAVGVDRDVLHRTGPVEGADRNEVGELGRLHEPQRLSHPRRLELEDARCLSPREHLVRLRIVERDPRDVEITDELDRLVDHVEVAEAEEVHLQEPERLDVLHLELRHELLVGPFLLERDDVHQRLGADHHPGSVDRVGPGETLERPGQVDDLLRDRVGVDRLPELGAGLQALLECLARTFGDQLRDPVDGAVGNLEDAPRIADGGPRGHGREGDDLRDPVAAVLLGHVVDHAFAARDGEVDVHVRHRLAPGVQEPLEEQVVADRIEVGDLEAVGDEAAGGRAAAGADRDPLLLREVDEVPHDQEVVGEPHLADRLQLEAEPFPQLVPDLLVASREPLLAELDQVIERVAAARDRELREKDVVQRDLDAAALGDLERPSQRLGVAREIAGHLLRRLEVEMVGLEPPVVRVLERVARLDAEERLVRPGVLVPEVVDVAGRDRRQPGDGGQLVELGQDAPLHLEVRVLQLDVDVVAPEDLDEPVELGARVADPVLLERLADATREAAGERDHPGRVALEELPVDPRLVVVALEVAEARELDQVGVPLVVGGEQREMGIALLLRPAVFGDVDLAADHRLDAGALGGLDELHGARHRAVVGERDRRHLELGGPLDEIRNPAGAVEDRVLRVDVEVDERSVSHARWTPYKPSRRARPGAAATPAQFAGDAICDARGRMRMPPREPKQTESDAETAARYTSAVYGSILAAALIEALRAEHVAAEAIALSLLSTMVVFWLAHVWSGLVGDRIRHGPRPQLHRVIGVARAEWPLVEASFVPLLALLLGWAGLYGNQTAARIALAACIGQLVVWGLIVGHRAYEHWWAGALAGLTNGVLGLALIFLEVQVLHS